MPKYVELADLRLEFAGDNIKMTKSELWKTSNLIKSHSNLRALLTGFLWPSSGKELSSHVPRRLGHHKMFISFGSDDHPWWVNFTAHHWYYSGLPTYSNGPASLSNTPQQEWKSWQLSVLQSYFSSWEHQANFCYRMPWWETIQRDHSQNICRYQMLYLEHLPSSVSSKKNLFSFPDKGHAFLTWSILYPKFYFSSSCPVLLFIFQYFIRRIQIPLPMIIII